MLYRLFTENKNYQDIRVYLDEYFPNGYTLNAVWGFWHGHREKSLIIEIDIPKNDSKIEHLCYAIKKLNQQDKILVQRIESDSKLI